MTENTNFEDVHAFHEKYGLTTDPNVGNVEWLTFREKFMDEELAEFKKARLEGDPAGMFDALLDLVYVAMGTADGLEWNWQEGWNRVQEANMAKVRAEPMGGNSKRGSGFDVVKPAGWKAPDHSDLVANTGRPLCPGCGRSLRQTDVACRQGLGFVGSPSQGEPVRGVYCTYPGKQRFYPEEAS